MRSPLGVWVDGAVGFAKGLVLCGVMLLGVD